MKRRPINRWIRRCFAIILLLSIVTSAAVNLREAYLDAIRRDTERARICAASVTYLLNHQYARDEAADSDERVSSTAAEVLPELCRICRMDSIAVYTVDPRTSARSVRLSTVVRSKNGNAVPREYARKPLPEGQLLPGEKALLDGSKELQQELFRTPTGLTYSWLAPYCDGDGVLRAIISMDYSSSNIRRLTVKAFMADIIPFALSLTLGLIALLILVRRRIVLPIDAISASMKRFALDSGKKPEPLNIPDRDEIGDIAASYEKMTEDISSYVHNIEALTREKVETAFQLDLARRIQYGLVPKRTELNGNGFEICAQTQPARAVGGDFYDCFRRDEHSIVIFMGDVSGKGITAAIFMAMIKTAIREKLLAGQSPAEALNQTNDEICAQNPENLFATAFAAVFDPMTGTLRYANAGHDYPVRLKPAPEYLHVDEGIALGMFEDTCIREGTLTLPPGEGLLLYTDGVTDAVNPHNAFFGQTRLLDAVKRAPEQADSAEAVLIRVSRAVFAFCGGSEPFDDMAALALFRTPVPETGGDTQMDWQPLPMSLDAFDIVRDRVIAEKGDSPRTRQALLACDEWISNVISHSGATRLEYRFETRGPGMTLSFRDDGSSYDPTSHSGMSADFEVSDAGGMGMSLIRQTASEMRYLRQNETNELTLQFEMDTNHS